MQMYVRANATHMVSVSCVCVSVCLCVFACLCAAKVEWKWMLGHVHLRPTVITCKSFAMFGGTFWTYTRRRVEWTHGVFQRVTHDIPQHNSTTTRPQHHTETETETDRDREDRDREKRRRKIRDKTREEKTKEDKTRQEKRQDSFSLWWCMAVFCWCSDFLVDSVCARFLSLLNSVKFDSSSISVLLGSSTVFLKNCVFSLQLQFSFWYFSLCSYSYSFFYRNYSAWLFCGRVLLSRSKGMPSRREGPPSIWDTHGISGNFFVNPRACSSSLYQGGIESLDL